ncbi:LytR/AlgR family response regulator transcription factor [Flavobacterium caeni]|uniref:Two component transcriptional regulator, LytTR family n=1 Tax=Flavobacterium caeni TaxID=490189 RepID=A0A1G5J815_9FLAO|nr:LytTR family DNA-binding domain-containing protein [Flavobacterium caeni]SCY84080.1 two component transcriptional regulator, LytTR family [Flavobacterium caeni]
MIRAVIIEDEKPASDYLASVLHRIAPDVTVLKTIDNVKTAVQWLAENPVDLIFLDIHLGDDIGFSIFEKLKISVPVIFTTAYNQYAIRAFKLNSVDYLLKPIMEEDLQQSLDKFRSQKSSPAIDINALLEAMNKKPDYQERFMVVSGQKIKSILVGDVAYFLSEGRYVKLITKTNEKYLLDQSLESVSHKLDPNVFFRVNRQVIVGFEAIQQMVVWSKSRIKLELKPAAEFDVIVSIDNSGDFKRWLNR